MGKHSALSQFRLILKDRELLTSVCCGIFHCSFTEHQRVFSFASLTGMELRYDLNQTCSRGSFFVTNFITLANLRENNILRNLILILKSKIKGKNRNNRNDRKIKVSIVMG